MVPLMLFLVLYLISAAMIKALYVYRSTDSQLKLWDISKQQCLRTFKGHTNEKNFVGLATNGDYIACGKLFFN